MNKQVKISSLILAVCLTASFFGYTAMADDSQGITPNQSERVFQGEFDRLQNVSDSVVIVEPLSEDVLPYSLDIDMPIEHQRHAMAMCEEYGIDVDIFFSLMYHESRYQANAFNGSDYGYCQINKVNWKWLEEDYGLDIKDPLDNIEAGALMLSIYLDKANGDYAHALTGYNTGSVGYVNNYARKVMQYETC